MPNSAILRTGVVLAALLALGDLALLPAAGGGFPPIEVAVLAAALATVTLVAAVLAWRGGRVAAWTVAATRALSALSAVPAFFVAGVPAAAMAAASVVLLVSAVCVALLLVGAARVRAT
ncbi:hypothetical protein [Nocardiopsis aegyptia]|uniref:Integral membrane protein n=1 Tax=Nocardiopsis aegyptia TaxID=220378 RepID=A0A7Z0ELS8_9ACTN|nr:hypothetical protein [Nocardiopsis aegyptia]NYJ34376.1 hypothetical protein [Nocardiopsis aegyptia]